MPIILGGFQFQDFEIPEKVTFGGSQRFAAHELLGGARDINAMGPVERDIKWDGRFQGASAWNRARTIDAMRIAGQAVPLIVDDEFRMVLIAEFNPEYERSYQVPYSISCVVINSPITPDDSVSLDVAVASDIASVVSLVSFAASF